MHGFYYRGIFLGSEVVDCTVLRRMNRKTSEALSHQTLDMKLTELGTQEQRDEVEFRKRRAGLEKKIKAALKTIARPKEAARGKVQTRKRGMVDKESSRGSGW